jgi:hypothetical protein
VYLSAADMGYRLVGMPMDPPMMAGMFLIIVGLGLSLYGLYPRSHPLAFWVGSSATIIGVILSGAKHCAVATLMPAQVDNHGPVPTSIVASPVSAAVVCIRSSLILPTSPAVRHPGRI